MKLLVLGVILMLFNCRIAGAEENGLPAKLFPNINSVCNYINENVKDNEIDYNDVLKKLHERFLQHQGRVIYNWQDGIVIADINKDGIYEIFVNGQMGSGIVHSFIHCYDPANDKYYIISKRMEMDYVCFVYYDNIYIYGLPGPRLGKHAERKFYKPIFSNDELVLEEIDSSLYDEIIKSVDIAGSLPFDEVKNNDMRIYVRKND